MFDQIDKEEDGLIYIKDVLFYLKALSNDLDQNKEVKPLTFMFLKCNIRALLSNKTNQKYYFPTLVTLV